MTDEALSIVREFLRMDDPRLRKNALVALAALGTDESLGHLVDAALSDRDAGVRSHAELELVELTGDVAEHVAAVLNARLREKETRGAAYRLLGRLRGRGRVIAVTRLSPRQRLQLVTAAGAIANPDRRWRWRWRPVLSGVLGGVVGSFLILLYLVVGIDLPVQSQAIGQIVLLSPLLGGVLALFCTQRANPIGLQYDPGAAAILELALAAGAAAILGALLLLVGVLGGQRLEGLLGVPVTLACLAAAVRGGTLTGYGVGGTVRAKRYAQIMAGGAGGVLALTLLVLVTDPPMVGATVRFVVLPFSAAGVGLAAAFAQVDSATPPARLEVRAVERRLASALSLTAGLVLLLPLLPAPGSVLGRSTVDTLPVSPDSFVTHQWQFQRAPANQLLVIVSRQRIVADIPEENLPYRDFTLSLWDDKGPVATQDDPPRIDMSLSPGSYRLVAERIGESGAGLEFASLDEIFSELESRVSGPILTDAFTIRVTADRTREVLAALRSADTGGTRKQERVYSGTVTNLGYSWRLRDAETDSIRFEIAGDSSLTGRIVIGPSLGGSGPFAGRSWGDTVLVASASQTGDTILWLGRIDGTTISGPYRVTGGAFLDQGGRWRVRRLSGPRLHAPMNHRWLDPSLDLQEWFRPFLEPRR